MTEYASVFYQRKRGFMCARLWESSAALPSCAAVFPALHGQVLHLSKDNGGKPGARLHGERQPKWLSDGLLDSDRNLKTEGFKKERFSKSHFHERLGWFLSVSSQTVQITPKEKNKNQSFQILMCKNVVQCSPKEGTRWWVHTQMFLPSQSDAAKKLLH